MRNLKTSLTTAFLASAILFNSCSDDDTPAGETTDYSSNLNNIALNVITKNYETLSSKASAAASAADALTIGNEASLTQAKEAWKVMRIYWENSESNLFGPAGDEGLGVDGNIDSWPIDLQFVSTVLNGTQNITVDFIATQDANAKGFHALEYLLWGIDGQKTASQLTAREIQYIKAAAHYIANQTSGLYTAWSPTATNFSGNFTNPTTGIYHTQNSALVQIVDGMIDIADEVGSGKIEDPLNGNNGSYSLEDEESRFSNNSKADFADNIRGILYVYTGDYNNTNGLGISEIVAENNPTLDALVKTTINEAISAIENIPGTFTNAIQNNRSAVENAQDKVIILYNLLKSQLKPYIQNLD